SSLCIRVHPYLPSFPPRRSSDLLMIFITSPTSAWIVLLAWGLFRNAPFPVVYALLIDSVPRAAGTAMGIMIGVALGVSGVLAAWVSGRIIDAAGFTAHYVVLAAICLLGLLPLAFRSEERRVGKERSRRRHTAGQI